MPVAKLMALMKQSIMNSRDVVAAREGNNGIKGGCSVKSVRH
jgi:hypothetical protein